MYIYMKKKAEKKQNGARLKLLHALNEDVFIGRYFDYA